MGRKKRGDLATAFHGSGLTRTEYCRRESISPSVLQYHLKKAAEAPPAFVSVGTRAAIEIEAANGVKIRLSADADASVLTRVLEAAGARA